MYTIRKNEVIEVTPVRDSKRGTAVWCETELGKKRKLVSKGNLFETREDAEMSRAERKLAKNEMLQGMKRYRETGEKGKWEIVQRIRKNHGVKIGFSEWVSASEEELLQRERHLDSLSLNSK